MKPYFDYPSPHKAVPGCGRLFNGGICGCHLCTCDSEYIVVGIDPDDSELLYGHRAGCPLSVEI